MKAPTKKAKTVEVRWHEKTYTHYISEYSCASCGSMICNTLKKSNNMTRFRCDCGQEYIVRDKVIKNSNFSF